MNDETDIIEELKSSGCRDDRSCYDCYFYHKCYGLEKIEDIIEVSDAELLRSAVVGISCEHFTPYADDLYILEEELVTQIEERRCEFLNEWLKYVEECGGGNT